MVLNINYDLKETKIVLIPYMISVSIYLENTFFRVDSVCLSDINNKSVMKVRVRKK